jgi:hypothetical protein
LRILQRAGNGNPPVEGDELPAGWTVAHPKAALPPENRRSTATKRVRKAAAR